MQRDILKKHSLTIVGNEHTFQEALFVNPAVAPADSPSSPNTAGTKTCLVGLTLDSHQLLASLPLGC